MPGDLRHSQFGRQLLHARMMATHHLSAQQKPSNGHNSNDEMDAAQHGDTDISTRPRMQDSLATKSWKRALKPP